MSSLLVKLNTTKKDSLVNAVNEVNTKATNNTTEITKVHGNITTINNTIKGNISAIEDVSDRIEQLRATTSSAEKVDKVAADVTTALKNIVDISKDIDSLSDKTDLIRVEAGALTSRVTSVEKVASENKTAISSNATAIQGLLTRVSNSESLGQDNKAKIATNTTNLQNVTTRTTNVEKVAAENKTKITNATTSINQLISKTTNIENYGIENRSAITTIMSDMNELTTRTTNVEKVSAENKTKLATAVTDLTALKTRVSNVETKATNNATNIAAANTAISSVGNKIGNLPTLLTTDKTNVVAAMNELFQFASKGKEDIANALTGVGIDSSKDDTFKELADKIGSELSIDKGEGGAYILNKNEKVFFEREPGTLIDTVSSSVAILGKSLIGNYFYTYDRIYRDTIKVYDRSSGELLFTDTENNVYTPNFIYFRDTKMLWRRYGNDEDYDTGYYIRHIDSNQKISKGYIKESWTLSRTLDYAVIIIPGYIKFYKNTDASLVKTISTGGSESNLSEWYVEEENAFYFHKRTNGDVCRIDVDTFEVTDVLKGFTTERRINFNKARNRFIMNDTIGSSTTLDLYEVNNDLSYTSIGRMTVGDTDSDALVYNYELETFFLYRKAGYIESFDFKMNHNNNYLGFTERRFSYTGCSNTLHKGYLNDVAIKWGEETAIYMIMYLKSHGEIAADNKNIAASGAFYEPTLDEFKSFREQAVAIDKDNDVKLKPYSSSNAGVHYDGAFSPSGKYFATMIGNGGDNISVFEFDAVNMKYTKVHDFVGEIHSVNYVNGEKVNLLDLGAAIGLEFMDDDRLMVTIENYKDTTSNVVHYFAIINIPRRTIKPVGHPTILKEDEGIVDVQKQFWKDGAYDIIHAREYYYDLYTLRYDKSTNGFVFNLSSQLLSKMNKSSNQQTLFAFCNAGVLLIQTDQGTTETFLSKRVVRFESSGGETLGADYDEAIKVTGLPNDIIKKGPPITAKGGVGEFSDRAYIVFSDCIVRVKVLDNKIIYEGKIPIEGFSNDSKLNFSPSGRLFGFGLSTGSTKRGFMIFQQNSFDFGDTEKIHYAGDNEYAKENEYATSVVFHPSENFIAVGYKSGGVTTYYLNGDTTSKVRNVEKPTMSIVNGMSFTELDKKRLKVKGDQIIRKGFPLWSARGTNLYGINIDGGYSYAELVNRMGRSVGEKTFSQASMTMPLHTAPETGGTINLDGIDKIIIDYYCDYEADALVKDIPISNINSYKHVFTLRTDHVTETFSSALDSYQQSTGVTGTWAKAYAVNGPKIINNKVVLPREKVHSLEIDTKDLSGTYILNASCGINQYAFSLFDIWTVGSFNKSERVFSSQTKSPSGTAWKYETAGTTTENGRIKKTVQTNYNINNITSSAVDLTDINKIYIKGEYPFSSLDADGENSVKYVIMREAKSMHTTNASSMSDFYNQSLEYKKLSYYNDDGTVNIGAKTAISEIDVSELIGSYYIGVVFEKGTGLPMYIDNIWYQYKTPEEQVKEAGWVPIFKYAMG